MCCQATLESSWALLSLLPGLHWNSSSSAGPAFDFSVGFDATPTFFYEVAFWANEFGCSFGSSSAYDWNYFFRVGPALGAVPAFFGAAAAFLGTSSISSSCAALEAPALLRAFSRIGLTCCYNAGLRSYTPSMNLPKPTKPIRVTMSSSDIFLISPFLSVRHVRKGFTRLAWSHFLIASMCLVIHLRLSSRYSGLPAVRPSPS